MSAPVHDDALVAELREKGLVGPISDDFLADYREHRAFAELMKRVEEMPGGLEKLRRGMVQLGIISALDEGDEALLRAWSSFKTALSGLDATGPDATEEEDAEHNIRFAAADEVLCIAPATTLEGASAKLRRALIVLTTRRWVEEAIRDGDDATLFGRGSELDYEARLVLDAVAAIELVRGAA